MSDIYNSPDVVEIQRPVVFPNKMTVGDALNLYKDHYRCINRDRLKVILQALLRKCKTHDMKRQVTNFASSINIDMQ